MLDTDSINIDPRIFITYSYLVYVYVSMIWQIETVMWICAGFHMQGLYYGLTDKFQGLMLGFLTFI